MSTATATTREFINEYFGAMCGKAKDAATIDKYVADPDLKQHILATEAAFPQYELLLNQMVAEGDLAAVNATFRGEHKGAFAGIEPTGKTVTADGMMFYRVENGKILKFWMQFDMPALIAQLQA